MQGMGSVEHVPEATLSVSVAGAARGVVSDAAQLSPVVSQAAGKHKEQLSHHSCCCRCRRCGLRCGLQQRNLAPSP
jgi:hypothetical protein